MSWSAQTNVQNCLCHAVLRRFLSKRQIMGNMLFTNVYTTYWPGWLMKRGPVPRVLHWSPVALNFSPVFETGAFPENDDSVPSAGWRKESPAGVKMHSSKIEKGQRIIVFVHVAVYAEVCQGIHFWTVWSPTRPASIRFARQACWAKSSDKGTWQSRSQAIVTPNITVTIEKNIIKLSLKIWV